MKSRPLSFKPAMIRAILEGDKSETRRLPRYQLADEPGRPPAVAGELCYVKEAFRLPSHLDGQRPGEVESPGVIRYEADQAEAGPQVGQGQPFGRYRHAQFMPRRFARLELAVTAVRLERLQQLTSDAARAEGMASPYAVNWLALLDPRAVELSPLARFQAAWGVLHPGRPWRSNPLVWVVSFNVFRQGVTL